MKALRSALLVLASLALFATAVNPSAGAAVRTTVDWPQYRFDDNHTGFNPLETTLNRQNVRNLQLDWQAQLGDIVLASSPAVVNDTVYIGSSDGVLWAYPSSGCGQSLCTTLRRQSTSLAQIIDPPAGSHGLLPCGVQEHRIHRRPARARRVQGKWLRPVELPAAVEGIGQPELLRWLPGRGEGEGLHRARERGERVRRGRLRPGPVRSTVHAV